MISKENMKVIALLLLIVSSAYAGYLFHEEKEQILIRNEAYNLCSQKINISNIPDIKILEDYDRR